MLIWIAVVCAFVGGIILSSNFRKGTAKAIGGILALIGMILGNGLILLPDKKKKRRK